MTPTVSTPRLDLIAGTLDLASAERDDRKLFAELLNARVHEDWPPPLNDVQSLEYAIRYFHEHGERDQWGVRYFVRR